MVAESLVDSRIFNRHQVVALQKAQNHKEESSQKTNKDTDLHPAHAHVVIIEIGVKPTRKDPQIASPEPKDKRPPSAWVYAWPSGEVAQ